MYSLNSYAFHENCFCIENNKKLYCDQKRTYTNLKSYEKAKGKIIVLPTFLSSTEFKILGERYSGRKDSKLLYKIKNLFSTVFILENHYQANLIPNGIHIQNLSNYNEKEILVQPFSF